MLNVTIENKYGERLNLTNNTDYSLLQITGLTPPTATINTSVIATKDGSTFNSSRINERNIVITISPNNNIERTRINIYKYVKSKQYLKLYFKNGSRDVWIEGYVEAIDGDLYENPQKLQISIICPDPYFKSLTNNITNFSNTIDAFEFPFALDSVGVPVSTVSSFTETNVYNASDDETGIIIELYASSDQVLEPTIYNQTTGESMTIEYDFSEGDRIIINTRRGEKSIIAIHDGVTTNIINNLTRKSKWFNLVPGDNIFSYTCLHGAENLQLTTTVQPIFEGV